MRGGTLYSDDGVGGPPILSCRLNPCMEATVPVRSRCISGLILTVKVEDNTHVGVVYSFLMVFRRVSGMPLRVIIKLKLTLSRPGQCGKHLRAKGDRCSASKNFSELLS